MSSEASLATCLWADIAIKNACVRRLGTRAQVDRTAMIALTNRNFGAKALVALVQRNMRSAAGFAKARVLAQLGWKATVPARVIERIESRWGADLWPVGMSGREAEFCRISRVTGTSANLCSWCCYVCGRLLAPTCGRNLPDVVYRHCLRFRPFGRGPARYDVNKNAILGA